MASLIDIIERVRAISGPGPGGEKIFDYLIEQSLPSSLRRTALRVAESLDEFVRTQLQKTFTPTLTSGVASLTSQLALAEPIIVQFPFPLVEHSTLAYPLQPVPSALRLTLEPANPDYGYYTVKAGNIRTKDTAGSTTALTGTLNLTAQYIPTIANLPATLIHLLVEEIVKTMKGINLEPESVSLVERTGRGTS